ncbi:MAG: hypothetical protein D6744_14770, partial [Planctomycetota bacterium]
MQWRRDVATRRLRREAEMSEDKRRRLAQLAEQVQRLQQHRGGSTYRCPSGWSQLDAALGGGFACG